VPGRYQFSLPERPARDGWFRIGSLDVTTTALMVMLGVASMVWYAIDKASLGNLVYTTSGVKDGELWRLFTWPLVNEPDIWVAITMAFFWFVGHQVEGTVGRKRFTGLIVLMTVLPAAFVTIFDFPYGVYGLRLLAIALLVLFAFDRPQAVGFFGVPLWIFAAIIVGLDVLRTLGDENYGALWMELGAIFVGAVTVRQWGMLDELAFIPRFGQRKAPAKSKARRSKSSGSTVVEGPWSGSSPAPMGGLSTIEQMELDDLLDKTNAQGLDALSKSEKARLNELSKKLRSR